MKLTTAALALLSATSTAPTAAAFQPGRPRAALLSRDPTSSFPSSAVPPAPGVPSARPSRPVVAPSILRAKDDDGVDVGDEEEDKPVNPYADPNYPDLEFVNYDDPEYAVEQGMIGDEFFPSEAERTEMEEAGDDVEAKIEEMREDRRRRNDEFQFETYHESVLKKGDEYRGEWTLYRTSHFLPPREGADALDENGMPRLLKARRDLRVVSSGKKVAVETDSDWRVDGERIVHQETVHTSSSDDDVGETDEDFEREILSNRYWPDFMSANDFRGPQGIMCVGNAYTICDTVPHGDDDDADADADTHEGPFSEYRAEVGIQYKRMRMRVKLDYRTKVDGPHRGEESPDFDPAVHPPLYLRSLAVCRETRERWPRHEEGRTDVDDAASARLFGPPGAEGGLYDPPPVGTDSQAERYMMMELDGHATLLFPHRMDQHPEAFGGNGWVTSLDWTPGRIRYQVDRKVEGGSKIKGLRTLELSEVQGAEAEEYRPRDGGADMRQ